MTYDTDERVDAYIDALPGWQQAICRQVRDLAHAADPEVVETIKRTRQPYFVLQGNICALLAAKDHVNVFLYDGGIVPDPDGIITGGHGNKTARTVAIREGEVINAAAQTAKRSPGFSATYAAISRRRGKKIATIAIARKLLTRACHLLAAEALPASDAVGTTTTTHPQAGRVTKPRASPLSRHEPATGRARSSD